MDEKLPSMTSGKLGLYIYSTTNQFSLVYVSGIMYWMDGRTRVLQVARPREEEGTTEGAKRH